MSKITGQQLKKDLKATETKLDNLEHKIEKRFDLVLSDYRTYISEDHKTLLLHMSISDISMDMKLAIVIQAEANYIKATGNQVEMFN